MAKIVQFTRHGNADVLQIVEQPIREPEPDEVLIDLIN